MTKLAPRYHLVETKATQHMGDLSSRSQFRGIEEIIFRRELDILLGSRYHGGLLDEDALLKQLQQNLGSLNIHCDTEQIKQYLRNVNMVFRAKLASGEPIDAIPFTGMSYQKKRGRPRKPRKDEKPIVHNGKPYKSIKEAASEDSQRSYNALRQALWRQSRQENSI